MTILREMTHFQNVGASQTAIVPKIPLGPTYKSFSLILGGGLTSAHITNVKIRLLGKTILDASATDILRYNFFFQEDPNVALVKIHFDNFYARTLAGQNMSNINTSIYNPNSQFEITCELAAGSPTSSTLGLYAEIAPGFAAGDPNIAAIAAFLPSTLSFDASGTFVFQPAVGSFQGARLSSIHLATSTDGLTDVRVEVNGLNVLDKINTSSLQMIYESNGKRNYSAGVNYDVIDFTNDNNMSEALNTTANDGSFNNIQFYATFNKATVVNVHSRLITTVDQI